MQETIHKTIVDVTQAGEVSIRCPLCRTWQEFVVGPGDYDVDEKGRVWPEFVCMRPDRSCYFSGAVWLVNWN